MTRKREWKTKFTACVCAVFVLLALFAACGSGGGWKEHYDLGMKYLEEGNYEEAIVEFTKAIKIDAKQSIVYIGRGRAYEGLGKEAEKKGNLKEAKKQYEKALDDYEMAESYGNSEATKRISDVKQKLETIEQQIREQESLRAEQENEAELADGEMNAEEAENIEEETDETGNAPATTQRNTQTNAAAGSRNTSNRGKTGNSTGSTGNRNSGNSGNTGATGGNAANSGNTGNTGATGENAASPQTTVTPAAPAGTGSDVREKAMSYIGKTKDEVIQDYGDGYQRRFVKTECEEPAFEEMIIEELYYEDLGIGFRKYYEGVEDIVTEVAVHKDIDIGYGLRGGLTYPELKESVDSRFLTIRGENGEYIGEEWVPGPDPYSEPYGLAENLYCANISGFHLNGEWWIADDKARNYYEWDGDPYTTPGTLVLSRWNAVQDAMWHDE